MKVSHRILQLAAVLLVAFILLAVWAAFNVYASAHPTGAPASGPVLASYSETTESVFVASLTPSYLYNNTTEIVGGNVTLFTPITNWINVTMVSTLITNRTSSISLLENFSVRLSTPAWSKTLFASTNSSTYPAATLASLATRYDINVSRVVALANAIDDQLNYQTDSFTLTLDPSLAGSVRVPGEAQPIGSQPILNFTFTNSLIQPSGLNYQTSGSVFGAPAASSASGFSEAMPYLILGGSLAGVAGSGYVATRRESDQRVPPLEQLLEPYQEAIATTETVPKPAATTDVAEFADLVKIADTLGKPILRPVGDGHPQPRLYVVDGEIGYRYTYPARATGESSDAPVPGISAGLGVRAPSPPPAVLVRQLGEQIIRLRSLSLNARTSADAVRLARRAGELLNAGLESDAQAAIDQLSLLLDQFEKVPSLRTRS